MNYWERHIGDYARDAGHLTMVEHGAYTILLDRYYATEAGIQADQAHRICRARTREEKAAVDAVLAEFFTLADGVWRNGRADREIERMRVRVEAARSNGARGGRPKRIPPPTEEEPAGNPVGLDPVTQQKALQTPDPRHQTPVEEERARKRAARQCPADFAVTSDLVAWAAEKVPAVALSVETEKFRDYTFPRAISDWPGAWRNWMRKAAEMGSKSTVVVRHPAVNKQLALEAENRRVGEEWARMMKGEIA